MRDAVNWLSDDTGLLVTVLPKNRPALTDASQTVPTGPTISVNDGKKAQNRTYQDLLKNSTDEANFEILATSEIIKVDLNGNQKLWKEAAMYRGINISPDGQYVMLTTVHRPFSYIVPYRRFPTNYNIYDAEGVLVSNFLSVPLQEELPKGFMAERKGPRSMNWRSDRPSTLYWAEALDGGDPEVKVEYRDAIYQQEPHHLTVKNNYC